MCGSDKACGCGCEAKASPARARRERDVVITDRQGRPFDRPRRTDYRNESEYLDAYDDYRRRVSEAMESRGMQLSLERDISRERAKRHARFLDANARMRRDPSTPMVEGALYYLEWDAHDEGEEGTYVYQGIYPQTGAAMFRRVSRSPKRRVTIYLFPHEVRYLELLQRPRGVPAPPSSESRSRAAPELRPGRVLMRPERVVPRIWDEGIVGPSIARATQFQGFRRIDNEMFGVWSAYGMLYAQPRRP